MSKEKKVKFEANYVVECDICNQSPTVTVREVGTNKLLDRSNMCGPCYFGEAAMLDESEWN